ncbi:MULTISPECIES: class D sortase [Bacillaceae]|uniref:Class D sortase n=1 Tax=Evansella alkalicola TaxID=745819 RepID=A0ABS6JQK5_9BACI|nr:MULTISPECIES: class D sortase [Bacillaceae]MBU9720562.1 class D sortase [Bacillus alkalicola]
MKKAIALLFIMAGFIIIGFAGYEIYQTQAKEKEALEMARELVFSKEQSDRSFEDTLEDFDPGDGDVIGILHIPRLDADLPIVQGTHEDDLARGVGHYTGTAYPTDGRQILLSGHRDTVFRNLGKLELGDTFEIHMNYGTFVYEIMETDIVDADDRTVIDYSIDEELLTVSTCYPFNFVGSAPDRYILHAKPVE